MDATLEIDGSPNARDELVSLRQWLIREDDYRGRVEFEAPEIGNDQLGGVQEVLIAALGAGGLTALAQTVWVWLRTRRSELEVTIKGEDGSSFQVTAKGPVAISVAKKLDLSE